MTPYEKLNTPLFGVLIYGFYQVLIGNDWWTINPLEPLSSQIRGMRAYRLLSVFGEVVKCSIVKSQED
jgi:hypothetical protein